VTSSSLSYNLVVTYIGQHEFLRELRAWKNFRPRARQGKPEPNSSSHGVSGTKCSGQLLQARTGERLHLTRRFTQRRPARRREQPAPPTSFATQRRKATHVVWRCERPAPDPAPWSLPLLLLPSPTRWPASSPCTTTTLWTMEPPPLLLDQAELRHTHLLALARPTHEALTAHEIRLLN
jgi:hypothetical protein